MQADRSPSASHPNLMTLTQRTKASKAELLGQSASHMPYLLLTNVEAAASSAVLMAVNIKSPLILVITDTGHTASLVAKYRPDMPILSLVVPHVVRKGVSWTIEVRLTQPLIVYRRTFKY